MKELSWGEMSWSRPAVLRSPLIVSFVISDWADLRCDAGDLSWYEGDENHADITLRSLCSSVNIVSLITRMFQQSRENLLDLLTELDVIQWSFSRMSQLEGRWVTLLQH